MSIGIRVDNCTNVTLANNRFHNFENPVVAKNTKGLVAKGNVATYDSNVFRLKPLVAAVRRAIYG